MQDFDRDENIQDVFNDKPQVKCPTCGAMVAADAPYCPVCGAKLEPIKVESPATTPAPKKSKKPRYDANHRLIREDGDEAPSENYVPSHEYKYGDGKGHSLSVLSYYNLIAACFIPVFPFIFGLFGLATKNEKDKKLFKISIIVNILVSIAEIVYLYWHITH